MSIEDTITNNLPVEPELTFPPIAGFWRRLAAWAVDALILVIVGQILGWTFSSFWFQIGPYGRIVGLLFILPYFGVMNSCLGKGQTFGKRLFKIAVRDGNNASLGLGRSVLRIAILAVPYIFNQWAIPILQNRVIAWLVTIIIFGGGAVILYTMVFNRPSRQGIHDLICKTYVVDLNKGTTLAAFPQTARKHWIISGVLVGLAVLLAFTGGILSSALSANSELAELQTLYQTLQTDARFFSASVKSMTIYESQGTNAHSLEIGVWYKGRVPEAERLALMTEIASVVLSNVENIEEYDYIKVTVSSAYDLGIASGYISFWDAEPISVWVDRVNGAPTP